MEKKLPREFYDRDTIEVAKDLLGKWLVHQIHGEKRIGKIVEVEAYLGPHDLASHTSKGRTPRTEVMFGPPGHAYVYLIYGMYYCVNAVTQKAGHGSAVLLRALEPISTISSKTQGPGLLCNAMGITKSLNGHDLLSDDFYIMYPPENEPMTIAERPRVGVGYAKEWKDKHLRFYIEGNAFISRK